MTHELGNEKELDEESAGAEGTDGGGLFPDMARRAIAFGLSGFFLTEETIRKALGDTLPKDWQDFVVHQSERTRKEFMERLSIELSQTLERIDVAEVLEQMLSGRTVEVEAKFRLGPREPGVSGQTLHVKVKADGDEE